MRLQPCVATLVGIARHDVKLNSTAHLGQEVLPLPVLPAYIGVQFCC